MGDTHSLEDQKEQEVFANVHQALSDAFGEGAVTEVALGSGTDPAVFGFSANGVDYSLSVNRTP